RPEPVIKATLFSSSWSSVSYQVNLSQSYILNSLREKARNCHNPSAFGALYVMAHLECGGLFTQSLEGPPLLPPQPSRQTVIPLPLCGIGMIVSCYFFKA